LEVAYGKSILRVVFNELFDKEHTDEIGLVAWGMNRDTGISSGNNLRFHSEEEMSQSL
jgi:hypothetical protein